MQGLQPLASFVARTQIIRTSRYRVPHPCQGSSATALRSIGGHVGHGFVALRTCQRCFVCLHATTRRDPFLTKDWRRSSSLHSRLTGSYWSLEAGKPSSLLLREDELLRDRALNLAPVRFERHKSPLPRHVRDRKFGQTGKIPSLRYACLAFPFWSNLAR